MLVRRIRVHLSRGALLALLAVVGTASYRAAKELKELRLKAPVAARVLRRTDLRCKTLG